MIKNIEILLLFCSIAIPLWIWNQNQLEKEKQAFIARIKQEVKLHLKSEVSELLVRFSNCELALKENQSGLSKRILILEVKLKNLNTLTNNLWQKLDP